jgi:hypothetical protein
MRSVKDHQQPSNPKKKARCAKKHDKIAGLLEISANAPKSVRPSDAKGMVFGASPANMGLDVYTSDNGLVHWKDPHTCTFSVIVIPRHKTMQRVSLEKTKQVVSALNKLQKRDSSRSGKKTGIRPPAPATRLSETKSIEEAMGSSTNCPLPTPSATFAVKQRMEHMAANTFLLAEEAIIKATISAWPPWSVVLCGKRFG